MHAWLLLCYESPYPAHYPKEGYKGPPKGFRRTTSTPCSCSAHSRKTADQFVWCVSSRSYQEFSLFFG